MLESVGSSWLTETEPVRLFLTASSMTSWLACNQPQWDYGYSMASPPWKNIIKRYETPTSIHWPTTKITSRSKWFTRKKINPNRYSDSLWDSFLGCMFLSGLVQVLVQVPPWQITVGPLSVTAMSFFTAGDNFGSYSGHISKTNKRQWRWFFLSSQSEFYIVFLPQFGRTGTQMSEAKMLLLVACSGR